MLLKKGNVNGHSKATALYGCNDTLYLIVVVSVMAIAISFDEPIVTAVHPILFKEGPMQHIVARWVKIVESNIFVLVCMDEYEYIDYFTFCFRTMGCV